MDFRAVLILCACATRTAGSEPSSSSLSAETEEESNSSFAIREIDGVPFETLMGMFTQEFCSEMIKQAKKETWDTTNDSVDRLPQYTIDVWDHTRVINHNLWNMLKPEIERVRQRLSERFPGQARSLDWVFIRKYGQGQRDSLQAHKDVSTLSVIVPLNSPPDYGGGELFFIRKNSTYPHDAEERVFPEGAAANTTDFFFPTLFTGGATMYDNSVYHGIRSVTRGEKYSLVLFYDMPEISGVEPVTVTFVSHRRRPCELFFIPEYDDPKLEKGLKLGDRHGSMSFVGHRFAVRDTETRVIFGIFDIAPAPAKFYLIVDEENMTEAKGLSDQCKADASTCKLDEEVIHMSPPPPFADDHPLPDNAASWGASAA
uniref:Fe2OG dioxygenase domain-containing protein n=1 Tax=Lotharella oceanica TaxID=641309 RepID=A0A7S2TGD6_9EUKA|mmetsp:Transcript_10961/g.20989  ORF Transcript_10961/g.20989 Transcript_10961/m.20989 type:complete len:372 (+) Transcript_10961:33-1148(+)